MICSPLCRHVHNDWGVSMSELTDPKLLAVVLQQCGEREGRKILTCEAAFRISERFGCRLMDVTRVCNTNGIKIAKCQLGCFR